MNQGKSKIWQKFSFFTFGYIDLSLSDTKSDIGSPWFQGESCHKIWLQSDQSNSASSPERPMLRIVRKAAFINGSLMAVVSSRIAICSSGVMVTGCCVAQSWNTRHFCRTGRLKPGTKLVGALLSWRICGAGVRSCRNALARTCS